MSPLISRVRAALGHRAKLVRSTRPVLRALLEPMEARLLFSSASAFAVAGPNAIIMPPVSLGSPPYVLNALASFSTLTTGDTPDSLLVDGNGNLFGTTSNGGYNTGYGTAFEIAKGSGTITKIAQFNRSTGIPSNLVMDSSGNLFGVTSGGDTGSTQYGMVFEVPRGSTTYTTLAWFNGSNGSQPSSLTVDGNGNLFGTTTGGGTNGQGTVFELAAGSTTITSLASFTGSNGVQPTSLLIDSAGNLFGTTTEIGDYTVAAVFEVAKGSNAITDLAWFNASNNDYRRGVVLDAAGDLFGITSNSAANIGTVFEFTKATSTISTLASFDASDGSYPTSIVLDSLGNIFGATALGSGTYGNNYGDLFEIPKNGSLIPYLETFNGTNGSSPGNLTIDRANNIYGAAASGGANGNGTAFELSPVPARITGSIFNDANANGVRDAGESGLSGWTVYADLNANGQFDPGEPSAVTASDGTYSLQGPPGIYAVQELLASGYRQTAPSSGSEIVTVGAAEALSGPTFGAVLSDTAPPVATIFAPNIITAGGGSTPITVTYTDPDSPVAASSIDAGNITVTGPGGARLSVTGANVRVNAGDSLTAVYTVAAPGGTPWSAGDNGTYTVNVLGGQVSDPSGNKAAATSKTFSVNIGVPDTTAPAPTISPILGGNFDSVVSVSVTYADPDSTVNASTIAPANLTVTDPNHNALQVTNATVTSNSGDTLVATYDIAAPGGGSWFDAPSGTYTVTVLAGQVADTAGNKTTSPVNQTFNYSPSAGVTVPPTATVSSAPDVTAASTTAQAIAVTYSDAGGSVKAASVNTGNIVVHDPSSGAALNVTAASIAGQQSVDGPSLTVNYTVAAPSNGWAAGAYAITLGATPVTDTGGLAVASLSGSFNAAAAKEDNALLDTGFGGPGAQGTCDLSFTTLATATDADGNILAVGYATDPATGHTRAELDRVSPDGTVVQALVRSPAGANDRFTSVQVDPGAGDLLLSGSHADGSFFLSRYMPGGALDTSFGSNGTVTLGGSIALVKAQLAPDGSIYAVGENTSDSTVRLLHYAPNGTLDTRFGNGSGSVAINALTPQDVQGFRSEGLAVQLDGKVLVAGQTPGQNFGLVRLLGNGQLDGSFGAGGVVTADFGGGDGADNVSVDPLTGLIGVFGTTTAGGGQLAVALYNANGTPLGGFGTNGQMTMAVPSSTARFTVFNVALLQGSGSVQGNKAVVGAGHAPKAATTGTAGASTMQRLILPPSAATPMPAPRQFGLTVATPIVKLTGKGGGGSVLVTNSSSQAMNGTLTLTLYAWPGTTGSGELGSPMGTVSRKVKLKAGKSMSIKLPSSLHQPATPGTYYLLAGATLGNAWGNSAVASAPLVVSAAPPIDLSIHSTAPTFAGKFPTMTITLTNAGKALAKGTVSVTVYGSPSTALDNSAVQMKVFPFKVNLKPGQSRAQRLKLNVPTTQAPGSHYFLLKLTSLTGDTDAADKIAAVPLA